jgi:protein disulfide-isomerase A6
VKIGKVDATVHQKLASRFQIQGYPTIKFFGAGKKEDNKAEDYKGGRDSDSMVQFVKSKVGAKKKEIAQLTDDETYQKYCSDKKSK